MLKNISLSNFRSFSKKDIALSSDSTIIVGPNASGKTNILESIYLLATGKSFKAKIEEEMVRYEEDISRVSGKITNLGEGDSELEVIMTRGEITLANNKIQKAPRKKLLVNGVPRRLIDFAGNMPIVLFAPTDMDLVTESPSLRRKFLDSVLSQTDREYRRNILSYEKGLKQRNRILFNIRENVAPRSQLLFWNQLLVKTGDYLSKKREEFIEYVNARESLSENHYNLSYDKSAISESRLEQYKKEEVASATTLVGPHRDDFSFLITNSQSPITSRRDLSRFGSRGEQRMGILWLKMAELVFIEHILGEPPTLLLDDIFSELDHQHRGIVMEIIQKTQTVMTTADPHYVEGIKGTNMIEL